MNINALSVGTGIALILLLVLIVLEVIFLVEKNMVLSVFGAISIYWCTSTSLLPALEYDGVTGK